MFKKHGLILQWSGQLVPSLRVWLQLAHIAVCNCVWLYPTCVSAGVICGWKLCDMGAGNQFRSSGRAAGTLKYWDIPSIQAVIGKHCYTVASQEPLTMCPSLGLPKISWFNCGLPLTCMLERIVPKGNLVYRQDFRHDQYWLSFPHSVFYKLVFILEKPTRGW